MNPITNSIKITVADFAKKQIANKFKTSVTILSLYIKFCF